ncbi:MAG: penicillin-binding protein 2, partial [Lentisphaerae bacterium]|nr:penicillin-binding protein 2 [Lentisphaerota bacterium]
PRVSSADWRRLTSDVGRPLVNRAVAGIYPPGSTFKPMVSIAALVNNRADKSTHFSCPGYFALGRARFNCWRRSGHGVMAMRKAIEQSCNAYFCQLGLQCGYERLYRMADAVGFGRRTGIDLPMEAAGILPSNEWKIRKMNDAWRPGDTCNVSIGQGFLAVTPLQMALFTAAIANGGRIYRPRLVRGDSPVTGELVADLGWHSDLLEVVRGGMHDVVNVDGGTGKRARLAGVAVAGKTGTAEYGLRAARKKHAWMIAYAPFADPRYVAVIVIEDAISGGFTAAPLMKKMMQGIMILDGTLEPDPEGGAA